MKCVLLLGTGFLLLPAAQAQCVNVTLPNVRGLGQCLGTQLQSCPNASESLLPDLTVLLRCMVGILPRSANPASVLFNVASLFETVLMRLGTNADIESISDLLCRPFGVPLLRCENFTSRNVVCGAPVQISLTDAFDIGSCFNSSSLLSCEIGQTVSASVMTELIEAAECVLGRVPVAMGRRLGGALVCPFIDILNLAVREFGNALPFGFVFRAITRLVRGLTVGLIGSVVSC